MSIETQGHLEGVLEMLRPAARANRHDIVSERQAVGILLTGQPEIAGRPYSRLSGMAYRVDGLALGAARLDLDEDDQVSFAGDDIDLAEAGAVAQRQDLIALQ